MLARDVAMLVRAVERRAGTEALEGLMLIEEEVNAAIVDLVTRLRSYDGGAFSWSEIGAAMGMSKQAVQQRFRKAGGVRMPGGQPSRLR